MTVGFFATCLVNILRPSVGLAAAKALDLTGRQWVFPRRQTCCGQVAYNAGFRARAAASAARCASVFAACDRVVVPSGSCCGFLRKHAPGFADTEGEAVVRFAGKCTELSTFLTEENFTPPRRAAPMRAVYHDSCAGLRELGIKTAPRELLRRAGVTIDEMAECEVCCGFGGAFAEKFGGISTALADAKCDNIGDADYVLMGDTGCIVHLEGRLLRLRRRAKVMHWCEALFD